VESCVAGHSKLHNSPRVGVEDDEVEVATPRNSEEKKECLNTSPVADVPEDAGGSEMDESERANGLVC
jgi:hypothetical protein